MLRMILTCPMEEYQFDWQNIDVYHHAMTLQVSIDVLHIPDVWMTLLVIDLHDNQNY